MYDKQNSGISEPDNLGELLYILSTQEERNEDLIDQIEREAKRLAESNEDGYLVDKKGKKYKHPATAMVRRFFAAFHSTALAMESAASPRAEGKNPQVQMI